MTLQHIVDKLEADLAEQNAELSAARVMLASAVDRRTALIMGAIAAYNEATADKTPEQLAELDPDDIVSESLSDMAGEEAYSLGLEWTGDLKEPAFWEPSTC